MKLKDLLYELDLFLPNPYTAGEKVIFLNKTIMEIRRFGGKSDIYTFSGNGERLYPLPQGIRGENVKGISVNGQDYLAKDVAGRGDNFYVFLPEGFILIEPAPETEDEIFIYFSSLAPLKSETEFESEDEFLNQEINLDPEYKYLLLYGAMSDIAAALEDIDMSNNLKMEFNSQKRDALQGRYKKAGRYPVTREVKK